MEGAAGATVEGFTVSQIWETVINPFFDFTANTTPVKLLRFGCLEVAVITTP